MPSEEVLAAFYDEFERVYLPLQCPPDCAAISVHVHEERDGIVRTVYPVRLHGGAA